MREFWTSFVPNILYNLYATVFVYWLKTEAPQLWLSLQRFSPATFQSWTASLALKKNGCTAAFYYWLAVDAPQLWPMLRRFPPTALRNRIASLTLNPANVFSDCGEIERLLQHRWRGESAIECVDRLYRNRLNSVATFAASPGFLPLIPAPLLLVDDWRIYTFVAMGLLAALAVLCSALLLAAGTTATAVKWWRHRSLVSRAGELAILHKRHSGSFPYYYQTWLPAQAA